MANATITVLEADGTTETDVVVLDVGRQAASASKSVATCTEDKAVLDAIAASLALLDNSIASGNELQVDVVGALPAGTNAIGKLAANSGVDIGDVDITSIIPGTGATNLGKAEDAAHSSGDVGVMALAVRQDSQTALGADGDYVPLTIDGSGQLRVTGGGTQYTEDAAAASDPSGNMMMAVRRDTLVTNEVTADGDNIALKATNKGQLHVAAQIGSGTATATITDGPPAASDYALVVGIHPDSVNANGRAAAANSAPIVLANEDKTALVDDAAFTPGTSNVNVIGFQADESSTDSVDEGDAGAARMTLDRKVIVTPQPHTAGGLTVTYNLDVDESEDDVKTSAGCLYKIRCTNRATSARYVKLYNATAANTTVGSTAPLDVIPVPGNATDYTVVTESYGGLGLTFSTALCIAATTGFADNDTGAPSTNDVIVSLYYK